MTITEPIEPPDRAKRESYVEAHNAWVAEVDGVIVGFALIDGTDRHVEALFVVPGSGDSAPGRHCTPLCSPGQKLRESANYGSANSKGTRAKRFDTAAGWQMADLLLDGEVRLSKTIPA